MKKILVVSVAVLALVAMMFSSCAKAPTEKVDALNTEFTKLQTAGAQVFAQVEYDAVNAQMATLQGLMDGKKYKEAAALCDTISTAIEALKGAVEAKGAEMATAEVASAVEEVAKFKTLVTDNAKALAADAKKYQDQVAALEPQAGGLQAEIDNKNLSNAFNTAKSIKDQIMAATMEITTALEAAKAKKGGKKM